MESSTFYSAIRKVFDNICYFWSKTNRWHRMLFILLLAELRLIPSGQVGFLCNDPDLSHSFTGDTINWKWLLSVSIFLPLAVMLFTERQLKTSRTSNEQVFVWYKQYLFGLLINITIVQTLKLTVGSPRPHFFDTCRPVEALTCNASEYINSYSCTKAHFLSQSDKSFPSGHTSLAVHAAVFLAFYLHKRCNPGQSVRLVQVMFLLSAVICALSRMYDHRHHWWDILAGAVLSVPILGYTIFSLCESFTCACVKETTSKTELNSKPILGKLTTS